MREISSDEGASESPGSNDDLGALDSNIYYKRRLSTSIMSMNVSKTSLTHSITRFRDDFNNMQVKMTIFGESLNLCHCIAKDFNEKIANMETRLSKLEKRQRLWAESNYSTIIEKNKSLACKTRHAAKVKSLFMFFK